MSFRRDSYTILRIGQVLNGSIKIEQVPRLQTANQNPVNYLKFYGLITDKTLDDSINQDTGKTDYLLKIDDGTGSLWVKTSSLKAEELKKWDFIRVIGSINLDTSNGKDYELTVVSDAISKVTDHNWELVHILEAKKSQSAKTTTKSPTQKTTKESLTKSLPDQSKTANKQSTNSEDSSSDSESISQKIERILRENDSGNGVEFSVILGNLGEIDESEVDDILFELAYEGKVYQPRPDYYRIMD